MKLTSSGCGMWGVKKSIWATNPCNCQHKLNKDLSQILCPQTEQIPNMTSHWTLLFYKQRHKQPHWYSIVSFFTGRGWLCQITRTHVHIDLLYKLESIFFFNYLKKNLFWNMQWPQLNCSTEHFWLYPLKWQKCVLRLMFLMASGCLSGSRDTAQTNANYLYILYCLIKVVRSLILFQCYLTVLKL